jgi:DNA-binding response OmpR family regulator
MKILLVEDDAALVRALRRGLSAHGHELISAENGEDGVAMARDEAVDFVLLDISLPELDGQEVLRRIRASRPELPVLMLTARDDLLNKVTALNAGADDYLTKPFEFEELLARRPSHRSALAPRLEGRQEHRPLEQRIRLAGTLHAPPGTGLEQRAALIGHMGLLLRYRL